jgi:hypothetical protein
MISNNVISLCHLPLLVANQVSSKPEIRDEFMEKCFGTAHTLSKAAYTLLTLLGNGSKMPVEKQRDSVMWMILLCSESASPYCLSKEERIVSWKLNPKSLKPIWVVWLGTRSKTEQVIEYNTYGIAGNSMADKVLTQHYIIWNPVHLVYGCTRQYVPVCVLGRPTHVVQLAGCTLTSIFSSQPEKPQNGTCRCLLPPVMPRSVRTGMYWYKMVTGCSKWYECLIQPHTVSFRGTGLSCTACYCLLL